MTSQEPDKIVLNEENTEEENKDFDDDFEDEFQDEELPATDFSQSVDWCHCKEIFHNISYCMFRIINARVCISVR